MSLGIVYRQPPEVRVPATDPIPINNNTTHAESSPRGGRRFTWIRRFN